MSKFFYTVSEAVDEFRRLYVTNPRAANHAQYIKNVRHGFGEIVVVVTDPAFPGYFDMPNALGGIHINYVVDR